LADHGTFIELYLHNESSLRAFIRALVRDRAEAEDVFQTVVLLLWKKFDNYDGRRPFGPWARGIAANEVLRMRRGSGRTPTPFSPEVVEAILDSFERRSTFHDKPSARLEALEQCVDALPDSSRQLLTLRYRQALAIGEIVNNVGGTIASVQKTLSRIRQRLADCIERRLTTARAQ